METRPKKAPRSNLLNEKTSYYEILGVYQDATIGDIKKAWRELVLEYHPDKANGTSEEMTKIYLIKDTLTDPVKRDEYDKKLNSPSNTDETMFKKSYKTSSANSTNETEDQKKERTLIIKQLRIINEYLKAYLGNMELIYRRGETIKLQIHLLQEGIQQEIKNYNENKTGAMLLNYHSTLHVLAVVKTYMEKNYYLENETYKDYLIPCAEHCKIILKDVIHCEQIEKIPSKKEFLIKLKNNLIVFSNQYLKEKGQNEISDSIYDKNKSIIEASHRESIKNKDKFIDFQNSFEALPTGIQQLIVLFRKNDLEMRVKNEIKIAKPSKNQDLNIILQFDEAESIVAKIDNRSYVYSFFRKATTSDFYQDLKKDIDDFESCGSYI